MPCSEGHTYRSPVHALFASDAHELLCDRGAEPSTPQFRVNGVADFSLTMILLRASRQKRMDSQIEQKRIPA